MEEQTERASAMPADRATGRHVAASHAATAQFLDRLVKRLGPHVAPPQAREETILCGRWLSLRRIDAGLSHAALAARTGLSSEALLFLEVGLADAALAPAPVWQLLAAVLGAPHHDSPRVAQVIQVALGGACGQRRVVAYVRADLNAAYRVRHPPPAPLRTHEFRKLAGRACHARPHARE